MIAMVPVTLFAWGLTKNNAIYVCSLGKYDPQCLLTRSSCSPNQCLNDGLCVLENE